MTSKIPSQRLVIDISVGVCAGGGTQPKVVSKPARIFLQGVLDICHRMVWTPEIKAEWRAHQTAFTRTWLTAMFARRRVDSVGGRKAEALLTGVLLRATTERHKAALRKDFHLVQAALATDRRIVSADEMVRELLRACATDINELKGIAWVNPNITDEAALTWLEGGAKLDSSRLLGENQESKRFRSRPNRHYS